MYDWAVLDLRKILTAEAEGKAYSSFQPNPRLAGFEDAPTYQPGPHPREDSKISQGEASRHSEAYGGNIAIDWVMDCVRLYSDIASAAEWHLEKDGARLERKKLPNSSKTAEIGPADLYRLLDSPNPFMDYAELVELLVIDLLLVGNAYWFKWRMTSEGKPLALYRLAPAHVKIIPSEFGPKRYEYQPPGAKDPLKIQPEQLVHMKLPNPHNAYYGLGLIQGGGRALDLELALTDTQSAYYENNADPSLIIESERRVPRDVMGKLRAQLRAKVAGSRNAGELLVLEAGLKANTLSRSAREALFNEVTKMSRDRVFAMFRASPKLFGIIDEQAGSDKVSDFQRQFDTKVMTPFLTKMAKRVTAGLTAAWGVDYCIDYMYRMPEEEIVKQAGTFASIPGVKVIEVRTFMGPLGIDPSTGNPDIDEMVLNLPTPEIGPDGMVTDPITGKRTRAAAADRPLPGEPGRPPKGSNTRSFGQGSSGKKALSDDDIDAILHRAEAESKALPSHPRKLAAAERPDDAFLADRDADISSTAASMRTGILEAIHILERDLLDHSEGKAFKKGTDLVARVRKSETWKTFMAALAPVLEKGARNAASSASIHSGLHPDEDIDYDALAKRIVHRRQGLEGITANLRNEIAQKVGQVLNSGGTRDDVDRAIREALDFWRETHAETVALTEAVTAYNEATLDVAEAAGVSEVLVRDGDEDDQPCVDADGSIWTIAHAREHLLEHPRCRRAFTPLAAVS